MFKLIFFVILLNLTNGYAKDLQSKFRNSDKSTYEGISSDKILKQGHFQTSFSYSLVANPYKEKNNNLNNVNELQEFDFSMVYGFNRYFELGISVPFISTTVNNASNINKYSGASDVYIEGKINILDKFALIPVFISSLGNGEFSTGASNGYGLRLVGSSRINKKLNFNYTLGQLSLNNGVDNISNIDQVSRTQLGAGINYAINDSLYWGSELLHDTMKNRSSTELLNHITLNMGKVSARTGVGTGLFNENNINDVRVFVSFIGNFSLFSKENKEFKEIKRFEPVSEDKRKERFFDTKDFHPDIDFVDTIQEEDILRNNNSLTIETVDKDKLKEELSNFLEENHVDNTASDSMEGHSVLPFYTIEEVRRKEKEIDEGTSLENKEKEQINKKFLDKTELSLDDLNFLESREARIKETVRNMDYFLNLYKNNEISKEKAIVEFNWGKRLLKMRRNSIDEFSKKVEEKYGSPLDKNTITAYSSITKSEEEAVKILDDERKTLKKIIKKAKSEENSEPIVKHIKVETEKERAERLTKEQSAVLKDGRTLLEINQAKKEVKNKVEQVKQVHEVKEENLPEIVNIPVIEETIEEPVILENEKVVPEAPEELKEPFIIPRLQIELRDTDKVLEETKNKINSLIEKNSKKHDGVDYNKFYNDYEQKIKELKKQNELKRKLNEKILKEKEKENKKKELEKHSVKEEKVLEKERVFQQKEAGEVQVIELEFYKVKTIEDRYEELKKEQKAAPTQQERLHLWNNPNELYIEEDGYIEKSSGPSF